MTPSSQTQELLSQAENSFINGDKKAAGLLIDEILKNDFLNKHTWLLLHRMIGKDKPFVEFQRDFTHKYYPNQEYLLTLAPQKESILQGVRQTKSVHSVPRKFYLKLWFVDIVGAILVRRHNPVQN